MPQSKKSVTIIDIGSASVGGAAARLLPKDKNHRHCPAVDYSVRHPITISDNLTFKVFTKEILSALEKTLQDLAEHNQSDRPVLVFLSSPFYLAKTKIIRVKKERPFEIKRDYLNRLTQAAAKDFVKDHQRLYPELIDDTTMILENAIMQIKLNGYETGAPFGQEVRMLSAAQYLTITSRALIDKFKEVIGRKLETGRVVFHSFAFTAFNTLRDIANQPNFLIIDISGELTDLAVVTDGFIADTLSFPAGRNFLIQGLARQINSTPEEAYSRLKMHQNNELDKTAQIQLESILTELKKGWLTGLYEALGSAMEEVLLPETVFIIGDDVLAGIFADWMTDKSLIKFSLADKPLKTKLISSRDLDDYCVGYGPRQSDPFFQIEALFAAKTIPT